MNNFDNIIGDFTKKFTDDGKIVEAIERLKAEAIRKSVDK